MKADYVLLIIFRTKGTPRYTQVSGTPCSRYTHTHTHLHTNAYTLTDSKPTIQSKVSNSDFRSTSQLVEKAVPTWLPTEKQNNKELFSSTFRAQRPPCLQLHNKQAEYWPGLLSVCVCVQA